MYSPKQWGEEMQNATGVTKEICPVCHGTKKMVPSEQLKEFIRRYSTAYSEEYTTESVPCNNCGGQTQTGKPTGYVYVREGGVPCTHQYTSQQMSMSYRKLTCIKCGATHFIDSGD